MLYKNLKYLRVSIKKSQAEIANLLNLSQQSYARYEKGETEPDIEKLKILANFYNITIDELISGKNNTATIISQGGNMQNRPLKPEEKKALHDAVNTDKVYVQLNEKQQKSLEQMIEWFEQLKK